MKTITSDNNNTRVCTVIRNKSVLRCRSHGAYMAQVIQDMEKLGTDKFELAL